MPPTRYCVLCGKVDLNYALHSFPKDANTRSLWISACDLPGSKNVEYAKLCSKHFNIHDYIDINARQYGGYLKLKKNVVPTMNVPNVGFQLTKSGTVSFMEDLQSSSKIETFMEAPNVEFPPSTSFEEISIPFETTIHERVSDCNENRCTESLDPSTQKKRKFKHPRYISEISSPDFRSPKKAKLAIKLANLTILKKNKQIRRLQHRNKYLNCKVQNMQDIIVHLQNKNFISQDTARNLMETIPEPFKEMVFRKKNMKYSASIRSFALTLQFYSSRAYNYVRSVWKNLLPHPSTLKKWYATVDGKPGFTQEAFTAINLMNIKNNVLINIVIDEMAIREQMVYTNGSFCGQINLGTSTEEVSDTSTLATNALVFMAVALNQGWKIPLGYFLIKGLSGSERANLLIKCFELIEQTNAKVHSITFDGAAPNLSMCAELGANFNYGPNFKPWFKNPITGGIIYVFLDACHMIKLVRNTLGDKGTIFYKDEQIKFDIIKSLFEVQKDEGLHCGAKLTQKHINYGDNRMKVKLAVQLLSRSTAKALEFLQALNYSEKFKSCEATAQFCITFNDAFDILNCKNKFQKRPFKMCLNNDTKNILFEKCQQIIKYIELLKDNNGNEILKCPRKTGFIGFVINLTNIFKLYNLINNDVNYLLTFKLSQDFLETFFSAIRSRGGFNNNPNAQQFESAYKRLLLRHEIRNFENSNVSNDNLTILNVSSVQIVNNLDFFVDEDDTPADIFDHDYIHTMWTLNPYIENVVKYISGFVAKKIQQKIGCNICSSQLFVKNEKIPLLIQLRNIGGLENPAQDVIKICTLTERKYRENSHKLLKPNFKMFLQNNICRNVNIKLLFNNETMKEHFVDNDPLDDHKLRLVKCIISEYLNIRLFYDSKQKSEKEKNIRNKFTKLILFRNQ